MIITPLRKDFTDVVSYYIEDLKLQPEDIKVFIDIQNLSLGQYDPKISEQYYLNENFNPVEILDNLLYWLSIKHNEIYHKLGLRSTFVLYTDTGRNIFNETLIPGWKEERKKSYLKVKEEKPYEYQTMLFAKQTIDSVIDALHKFANTSTSLRTILLRNIDSDFIPELFRIKNPNSLIILLSSDHDYYHMLNEDNVIRYVFLNKTRKTLGNDIEHKYNSFVLVKKKYGLDTDEAKLVSRYYQVFHCLIGDSSDNVKSLIPRKGIKYWIKKLKDVLPKFTIEEIRQKVVDNECFIDELLDHKANSEIYKSFYPKPETKWGEFRLRFFVFDFNTTSKIVLKDENVYPKIHNTLFKLDNVINDIHNDITIQLNQKTKLSIQEAYDLLNKLGLKNSDYISKSLFY